jgi:arsenate reductase-like glutaredoxin family protein
LDANGLEPREIVPASRKLGKSEAAKLARDATKVIVAKGKSTKTFRPGGRAGADVVSAMLGPTGNLRSPLLRAGKTVIVGFNEDEYAGALL